LWRHCERRRKDLSRHKDCHAPRKRGIQYAAAHRFNHRCPGILGRPVEPGDDTEYASAFSRHDAPEVCMNLSPHGGRGECRVPDAPAARVRKNAHGSHHGRTGITRHSRTRMVLTAYAALSPETNSSCLRHRRIDGCARPGWVRTTSADLAPATGARTTRFCRPRTVFAKRLRGQCTSAKLKRSRQQRRSSARLSIAHGPKPALQSLARPTLPRPPHPIPTSVTIAIRPS
jgi:hypothetical protein